MDNHPRKKVGSHLNIYDIDVIADLVENIPSDSESIIDDFGFSDSSEEDDHPSIRPPTPIIASRPIDFINGASCSTAIQPKRSSLPGPSRPSPTSIHGLGLHADHDISASSESEVYDSDDNIPLQHFAPIRARPTMPIDVPKWGRTMHVDEPDPFLGQGGVADFIKDMHDLTPCKIFKLLFTDDLLNHIVLQTNIYAQQEGKLYTPTTNDEMASFIGINLLMGIKKMPSFRDYWSSAPDLRDKYIASIMPLNRFNWLLGHLHLNDNNLQPARGSIDFDKLYKLRPFLNTLSENFSKCFKPNEAVAIDESMIKFKGRSSLKQYLPKKPIKRGYKVWMLCDSTGYNLKFEIYTGKSDQIVELNLGGKVVTAMCSELVNKNHRVYFDNYFTSYALILSLLENKIFACGTVNSNRRNLPALKEDKALKRGEYDWSTCSNGISMVKWKDKRSVHILSNFHDPRNVVYVQRKEKDGSKIDVPCPIALREYNANMNFVDKFDQLLKYYSLDRKSKKWWHRIFFHMIDSCIVNAYIIYHELGLPPITMKNFRRRVIDGLLAVILVHGPKIRKRSSTVLSVRQKPQVPVEIRLESSKHQPLRSTSKRCAKCSTKKKPVRTVWMCKTCGVPLCLRKGRSCFQDFHA